MQRELGITFVHVTHTQLEAIAVADMVVVMDQGRVEQAGSAREIYTLPVSAYVARFMGGQNVLAGKVVSVAGGVATLMSDTGERFSSPLNGATVAEGDVLHCCVRRDRVALERGPRGAGAPSERPNAVAGAVHAIEYQGAYVKVTIDVPGREAFVANLVDRRFFADPVDIGDPVVARWAPEEVHLLRGDLGRSSVRVPHPGQVGEAHG
jgi:putative spermidine/putrescine transport system ATP-binding protein